jgi:hypothetical protein
MTDGLEMKRLEDLIEMARSGELDQHCVYGPDGDIEVDGVYAVADYPSVVNDVEIYPSDITARGLSFLYSGDQFTDVIEVACDQVEEPSPTQIADSLRYYAEHDTFLEF